MNYERSPSNQFKDVNGFSYYEDENTYNCRYCLKNIPKIDYNCHSYYCTKIKKSHMSSVVCKRRDNQNLIKAHSEPIIDINSLDDFNAEKEIYYPASDDLTPGKLEEEKKDGILILAKLEPIVEIEPEPNIQPIINKTCLSCGISFEELDRFEEHIINCEILQLVQIEAILEEEYKYKEQNRNESNNSQYHDNDYRHNHGSDRSNIHNNNQDRSSFDLLNRLNEPSQAEENLYEEASESSQEVEYREDMSYEDLLRLDENIKKPLNVVELSRLPVVKITKTMLQNFNQSDHQCPICLEGFKVDDKATTLTCFHHLHYDCSYNYFKHNKVCPICKTEMTFKN